MVRVYSEGRSFRGSCCLKIRLYYNDIKTTTVIQIVISAELTSFSLQNLEIN